MPLPCYTAVPCTRCGSPVAAYMDGPADTLPTLICGVCIMDERILLHAIGVLPTVDTEHSPAYAERIRASGNLARSIFAWRNPDLHGNRPDDTPATDVPFRLTFG